MLIRIGKMKRDNEEFQKFEKELIRNEKLDIENNFRIIDAMYDEAVELGAIPVKDPLEGIETDIKVTGLFEFI
jgi:hypothetical protein